MDKKSNVFANGRFFFKYTLSEQNFFGNFRSKFSYVYSVFLFSLPECKYILYIQSNTQVDQGVEQQTL